jgi:hypothetical protein
LRGLGRMSMQLVGRLLRPEAPSSWGVGVWCAAGGVRAAWWWRRQRLAGLAGRRTSGADTLAVDCRQQLAPYAAARHRC